MGYLIIGNLDIHTYFAAVDIHSFNSPMAQSSTAPAAIGTASA